MTTTKRCTKCGETKPLDQFHLRSKKRPDGPRRSHCKACTAVADRRRYLRGLSVETQIIRKAMDPTFELSPEAEAAIHTPPVIPEAVRKAAEKNKARAHRQRKRAEKLERERGVRPMRASRKFETVTL